MYEKTLLENQLAIMKALSELVINNNPTDFIRHHKLEGQIELTETLIRALV